MNTSVVRSAPCARKISGYSIPPNSCVFRPINRDPDRVCFRTAGESRAVHRPTSSLPNQRTDYECTSTKTENSMRTLAISPQLVTLLWEQVARQNAKGREFLFSSSTESPLDMNAFRKRKLKRYSRLWGSHRTRGPFRTAVYSSRIAVTGFRRIARCAGK